MGFMFLLDGSQPPGSKSKRQMLELQLSSERRIDRGEGGKRQRQRYLHLVVLIEAALRLPFLPTRV